MPKWAVGVLLVFVVYFPLAWWAKRSYVMPAPEGAIVLQLYRPFVNDGGLAWRPGAMLSQDQRRLTGDAVVYENHDPLLSARSYAEVAAAPGHFRNEGKVWFSTSDGSDPNSNGRRYWAVVPDGPHITAKALQERFVTDGVPPVIAATTISNQ